MPERRAPSHPRTTLTFPTLASQPQGFSFNDGMGPTPGMGGPNMGNMAGGRPPSAGPGAWAETPAMGQMGGDPRMMNPGPGMMNPGAGPGGMPRMSSGPPPSAFPRPPSFSTPASGGMGAGAGFAPPPTAGSMPGGPPSFTDRPGMGPIPGMNGAGPGAGPTPSYDVVHLSARNARLEEKLSKALAKNRSMAKYYDQLLAKTRDAQEREIEDLKSDLMRLQAESAAALGARDSLQRVAAERDAAVEEMNSLRDKLSAIQRKGEGHDAQSTKELNDTRLKLAQRDGEVASLKAQLSSAQTMVSTANPAQTGQSPVDHSGAVQAAGSTTLAQMQRMLDAAREERNHERRQAAARDGEMARQLNDIKEQALDRIRESSAAAKEVAALKERVHAAEHERDRLRDRMEEMEGDVSDHRELRRRMQQAEERATTTQKKADRCELSEAKLRAAEANAQNLQEERAQAHKRLQEMTEKLLHVTNEKDVLVRHSAHQVHVEAELANTRRELEQAKRSGLAVRTERKTHAVEWNEAADNMGRVLRHHIYSHTRWEKDASDEVSGAHEAHAHGQRSAVRLVAAAEAEAASLAGEAVEVVRTTRQLLREHARECAEVIAEVTKVHAQRADERIDAALSMLREAEVRAERAESDAERSAAEARRAKAAATRAGVIPSALLNPHERDGQERLDEDGDPSQAERPQRGMVREEDFDDEAERATRRLRVSQFQMLGLAMWRRATSDARTEGHEMLHSQLVLARREAAVASARSENWYVFMCSLTVCPYELCVSQGTYRIQQGRSPSMVAPRGGVVAQTGEGAARGDGRRGVRADPEDAPVAGGGDGTGRVERGGGSARAGVRSQPRVARGSATGTRRRAEAAAEGARAAGGDIGHGQARLKAQPEQRGRGPAGVAAAEDAGGTFTPGGPGGGAGKGGERVGQRRRKRR